MNRGIVALCFCAVLVFSCSGGKPGSGVAIGIEPTQVTFGKVNQGESDSRVVRIWHDGDSGVLKLSRIYWLGQDQSLTKKGDLSFTPPAKLALNPGEETKLVITYTPTDLVNDSGTIVIEHNVPPDNKSLVSVNTMAQIGNLRCYPNPIDFGEVKQGETKDLEVRIVNEGSGEVDISSAPYLFAQSSEDFKIVGDPVFPKSQKTYPAKLMPGEEFTLTLSYTPTMGGADYGNLIVETITAGAFESFSFDVFGKEVGPKIIVSPGEVDFGVLNLGESKEISVTIDNDGAGYDPASSMLVIPAGGISLAEGADEALFLKEEGGSEQKSIPAAEWRIKAEEYPNFPEVKDLPQTETFVVKWTAQNPKPETEGAPIGKILITSNDMNAGLVSIDVRGRVAVPFIDVFPKPVNFGYVAQGVTGRQTITIVNNGQARLLFTAPLKIVDDANNEFGITETGAFLPSKPDFNPATECPEENMPASCYIEPGGYKDVVLTFTNKDGETGDAHAKLVLESNAYNAKTLEVDLSALRAGAPTCIPGFTPPAVNFGAVIQGESKTLTMFLENKGSGYCTLTPPGVFVNDCPTLALFMATCQKTMIASKYFTIDTSALPPLSKDNMPPNSRYPIKVTFNSPGGTFMFTEFYGVLWAEVMDYYKNEKIEVPPKQSGGFGQTEGYPINLMATLGFVNIVVTPKVIDFGNQVVGCGSLPKTVKILNTGNAPLTLKDISFYNCTPEMRAMDGLPPSNTLVQQGQSLEIRLQFVPQDDTKELCYLKITSNDLDEPVVYVKLQGKGVPTGTIVDKFNQVTGDKYDFLVVLDDCACTMVDYGSNIEAAISSFVRNGAIWGKDFHVGIINMNIEDKSKRGKFNEHMKNVQPRYVQKSTPSAPDKFYNNYSEVAKESSSDSLTKGGLLSGYLAVTEPLQTLTNTPCQQDTDCLNDPNVCPDPSACDLECVDGYCGGYNWGFVRDDAYLDMVFISKADDQSPGPLSDYIDMMYSVKGRHNKPMTHFHCATWVDRCEGHAGHGPGERYIALSKEFDGKQAIICDDFAWILNEVASGLAPLKVQFFLSAQPVPPTSIQVKVNGQACTSGWQYEASTNSIVFDPTGLCMPQYSQPIEVTYTVGCQP
jgi:hypothetical protein